MLVEHASNNQESEFQVRVNQKNKIQESSQNNF